MAVRATVLALLLALVGGGATALAMDKTITLTVDGQDRTVHTFAGDVASALQAAGIAAAPQDRVEPALPTSIDNGDHVIFSRARRLILDEGPSQREVWTTAPTVGQALAGLGVVTIGGDPHQQVLAAQGAGGLYGAVARLWKKQHSDRLGSGVHQ